MKGSLLDDFNSNDIRGDLQRVLEGPLDFKGTFAFHKIYIDAPNPILRLDTLGHIGLPLSQREAKVVISHCTQAPFGKGERTVVDKSVRDTWEIDASQIHFDNPAWNIFMDGVVREVCTTLGVDASVSQPRCESYKLLLYETGSHFFSHQDTEKADGMFATIVVVLPSQFIGGAAHLSHGELSKVMDCATDSLMRTSVVAWYTDITHEIKPITRGYRLAISYNLFHTTNALRPSLPSTHSFVNQLSRILLSWEKTNDLASVPTKIIYLLSHKYSQANLKGSALKGADAHKVAVLEELAKKHNFHLGLANLECHLTGCADDSGGRHGNRCICSEEESEDVDMADVEERNMTIENLVDLENGNLITDSVSCEDDNELIPEDLRDTVEAGGHDEQEYEGYQGNGAGSLERWYRRTVLVVWPHAHNVDFEYGNDPSAVIDKISGTTSKKPDQEERHLIDYLIRGAVARRIEYDDVVQCICRAAASPWNDLELWRRAVQACRGTQNVSMLGVAGILDGISCFGFERVRSIIEDILKNEPDNAIRYDLLDELDQQNMGGKQPVDVAWVEEQRKKLVTSLKKPMKDEEKLLLDLAVDGGGVTFLQDTILPQVMSLADHDFYVTLATHLHSTKTTFVKTNHEGLLVDHIITHLLASAISKADFYVPAATSINALVASYPYHGRSQAAPSPQLAYSYIKACVELNNEALAETIVKKLIALSGMAADAVRLRAITVLVPLIPLLSDISQPPRPSIPGLRELSGAAVRFFMSHIQEAPTKEQLSAIFDAVVLGGGSELLLKTVFLKFKTLPPQEDIWRYFIQQLQKHGHDFMFPWGSPFSVASVTTDLVEDLIRRTNLGMHRPTMISLLNFCLDTGNAGITPRLLARIIPASGPLLTSQYITEVLVPLIPDLHVVLARRHISPTSEPFSSSFKRIMMLFVTKILGPKPGDYGSQLNAVKGISCGCVPCKEIVQFLTVGAHWRSRRWERIGAPARKHLEKNLSVNGGHRVATWSTIMGSPQGLQVTKSDSIYLPVKWEADQTKAEVIWKSISSDEQIRKTIFGSDYRTILGQMSRSVSSATSVSKRVSTVTSTARVSTTQVPGSNAVGTSSKPPAASQSRSLMSIQSGNPFKKRKRSSVLVGDDVIDLCSPSP